MVSTDFKYILVEKLFNNCEARAI